MNQLQKPSSDFSSVRDGRNAPDFYFDLDLSTTFDQIINIAGNSFYCDANPVDGNFVVYFQETDSLRGPTPFYASPGFIARIPFTQIRVTNTTAQPGKKARIVYGTDTDFQPGSVSQITLSGNVGINYPIAGFVANSNACQSQTFGALLIDLFAPPSGGLVWNLEISTYVTGAGTNSIFLYSDTIAAPSGVTANNMLGRIELGTAPLNVYSRRLEYKSPFIVPAGRKLVMSCSAGAAVGSWYWNGNFQPY